MGEFEFAISNDKVTGESRVEGDAATPVHIPSDATFTIGTDTITETVKTDHGTHVLDFSQDASDPSVYDLVKTSWDPSQGSGDGSGHHHHGSGGHGWSGDGWTGASDPGGPFHPAGVSNPGGPLQPAGGSDPGGPLHPVGVSDPVSAHGPGPAEVPSLETHIAQMHATGGSLI